IASLGLLIFAPALTLGLQFDDLNHRVALRPIEGLEEVARSPLELFAFVDGDPGRARMAMDRGLSPWFMDEHLRLSFFRPLSGLTHGLDFGLWPEHHWLMHLHSLLWYVALVLVAALCFRRFLAPAWVAGLATLLYAIDDAHQFPAVWLANRNAVIGGFFGILALVAHDRWRRQGSRPAAALAPVALLAALLANEGAVAIGGYLLAYALFIDTGARVQRWRSLLPGALVGVAWAAAYGLLGHGASGSGLYVDPVGEPLRFVGAVVERAPLLVWGQWAFPAADLHGVLSEPAGRVMWLGALGLLVVLAVLLAPLVRRDRTARFWALGAVLALLPACGTFAANRLLIFVGLGSMGLLAQYLAWLRAPEAWRRLRHRIVFAALIVVHVVLAPLGVVGGFQQIGSLARLDQQMADTLPADEALRAQRLVIVSSPSALSSMYAFLIHAITERSLPERALILAPTVHALEVRRVDARTLAVRPRGGLLLPAGRAPDGDEAAQPVFDVRYAFQQLDQVFRGPERPFVQGEAIALTGVTIEITELGAHGRPTEIRFRFADPLESPSLRWVTWTEGGYVPFALPAIGSTVTLAAPAVTL
ncbi:MAG TPA: hypothetical protein VNM90_08885, partial [Haliangium sp.]|nr:hypothetical protein [Haliangium sp.]